MNSRTRKICAVLAAVTTLTAFSACKGDGGAEKEGKKNPALLGNLVDVSGTPEPGDVFAEIEIVDYGVITFKLFPDLAPKSVEQFASLAERGYYDTRNIHRVVNDMLMQGGSFNFDGTDGKVDPGELLPLESSPYARNFYGALVLAPDAKGQGFCQFYVVNSKSPQDVDAAIESLTAQLSDTKRTITPEAKATYTKNLDSLKSMSADVREMYKSRGGLFRQDGRSTVIGQAIDGLDVIDAIARAGVVAGNKIDDDLGVMSRPLDGIIIKSVTITRIPYPEPTTTTPEETTKKAGKGKSGKTTTATGKLTTPPEEGDSSAPAETTTPPADGDSVLGSIVAADATTVPPAAATSRGGTSDTAAVPEPVSESVTTTSTSALAEESDGVVIAGEQEIDADLPIEENSSDSDGEF